MKVIISSLLLLLATFDLSAQEIQAIPDFSAQYSMNVKGLPAGDMTRTLSTDANGIRTLYSRTKAKGLFAFFKPDLIEETSTWTHDNNGIQPISYLYQRTGGKKDKIITIDFDWMNKLAQTNKNGQQKSFDINSDTSDKLIYQIILMTDLANKKTSFSYPIATEDKVKTYDIELLGEEIVSTSMGNINAVKLLRKRSSENKRQTTLWCAPSLNYLPVKLEHIEKGTAFVATLENLKGIDSSMAFQQKTAPSSPLDNR